MGVLIDPLVQGFIKEAGRSGSKVLVAYSAEGDQGQPVMRIASNVDEERTQAWWNWLAHLDGRAIEAGAKALYESCIEDGGPWDEIPADRRETFIAEARAVLNAAKSTQGRTLNIIQPGDKPV